MSKSFIPEIQGLRTLAALLVAVYHIWFNSVSGGVDIFFVVSAYFIAHSLNKYEVLSWREVSSYYSKTLRRILPSALIVFCCTCIIISIAIPFVSYKMEIKNAFSTFFFVENWYLAASGSDYLRQGESKSLFQQFWALSVQFQLYLCIPVVYLFAKKLESSLSIENFTIKVLLAIFACSFTFSLYLTYSAPTEAYFNTFIRAWEFIAGLLLYHLGGNIKISKPNATGLNAAAVLTVISFGFYWGKNYALPGAIALIPVLSASIIIITSKSLYYSILKWRMLAALGDYSFAFYLWHWPIYLLVFQYLNIDLNHHLLGISVILSSAILAFVCTKYIEVPLRRSNILVHSDRKTYLYSFTSMTVSSILLVCLFLLFKFYETPSLKALNAFYSEKIVQPLSSQELFPHGTVIKQDMRASYFNDCEQNMQNASIVECEYGNKDSDFAIALVGGSHAAQWLSPLREIAVEQGFKVHLIVKSGCSLTRSSDQFYHPSKSCLAWNKNLETRLSEFKPDVIMTTVTRNGPTGERIPTGYLESWLYLNRALPNTNIVGIRDNPWFKFDPPLCLEISKPKDCSISRSAFYNDDKVLPVLSKHLDGVLDFSRQFCPDGECNTVLANGLVKFKDKHHLTKSYALVLKPKLAEAIDRM
ncbi:acyltransferase family protein [Alteromonas lipotrueae]|uniref:acyltransferase family protein n=1 Tax=Alteromonas lipotrueae TaxID=2803814 RepID=UPI001C467A77|nr:acyltransferase family protein [Alteromonas lipotrueae]